jgi:hypothetical protein
MLETPPKPDTPSETKGKEPEMEAFRAEINKLKIERENGLREYSDFVSEQLKNGRGGKAGGLWQEKKDRPPIDMVEIVDVNPEELTESDAIMWHNVNNYSKGLITQSQFDAYKGNVLYSGNKSRRNFLAVIINKIILLWADEEFSEDE